MSSIEATVDKLLAGVCSLRRQLSKKEENKGRSSNGSMNESFAMTNYSEDMHKNLRSTEEIPFMYMRKQSKLNEGVRCTIVDWLIEVHYKFKLAYDTLYLTINVIDRFLAQSPKSIPRRNFQLVGLASLLLSCKYEEKERGVPKLKELTYICDGAYTKIMILKMEKDIFSTINHKLTVPTSYTFLKWFLFKSNADEMVTQLACFLLDGTLLSFENMVCRWRPSLLAAAAILLSRRQLDLQNWSQELVVCSSYDEAEVLPVARALLRNKFAMQENSDLIAVKKKYSKLKYGNVSHIVFQPFERNIQVTTLKSASESLDINGSKRKYYNGKRFMANKKKRAKVSSKRAKAPSKIALPPIKLHSNHKRRGHKYLTRSKKPSISRRDKEIIVLSDEEDEIIDKDEEIIVLSDEE